MEWLALSIALMGTIYFAIHSRSFRRGLLWVLVGMVGLGVLGGLAAWFINYQSEERRRIASTLIDASQIEISEAKLPLGIGAELSGVVTNRSAHDIAKLLINVTVTDCPNDLFADLIPPQPPTGFVPVPADITSDKGSNKPWERLKDAQDAADCGIVGQDVARVYSIDVPRGQKRAFHSYISLPNLPKMKEWSWHYSIKQIVAEH